MNAPWSWAGGRPPSASRLSTWLRGADPGSATAEFAIILPAIVVVALILVSLGRASLVRLSCQDAARAAAKEISVSERVDDAVLARARSAALTVTAGATVSFAGQGTTVSVGVTCPLMPGPLNLLPAHVQGQAVALRQGGASD